MKNSSRKAQSTIEYILMMVVIISVLIVILNPFGQMTKTVNQSLEVATQGIECMAENTCYPGDDCTPKYPNCASGHAVLP